MSSDSATNEAEECGPITAQSTSASVVPNSTEELDPILRPTSSLSQHHYSRLLHPQLQCKSLLNSLSFVWRLPAMFRNALRQSSRTAVGALTATGRVRAGAPVLSAVSKQARSYASESKPAPTEVSSILEQRIRGVQEEAGLAETGRVLSVGSVAATRNRSSGSPTNS